MIGRLRLTAAVVALVAWTFVVWTSRVRNVIGNDELTASGTGWRLAVVGVFLGLAAAVVVFGSGDVEPDRTKGLVRALCLWTVGFWLVRGIGIVVDDHDLGFTLLHSALMVASIVLAAWAWARPVAGAAARA